MHDPKEPIQLTDFNIESILFDQSGYWAGFRYMNATSGETMIDSPHYQVDHGDFIEKGFDMVNGHTSTRLIGFRTTKRCQTSKRIMTVEPIFYSEDEKTCTEHLKVLTESIKTEVPPAYGP